MYERFTDRARKVMQLAHQEALRLNHESIRTEHILLGIVAEGTGVAATVLRVLDVDLDKLRLEVERLAPPKPGIRAPTEEPQTSMAKRIIRSFTGGGPPRTRLPQTPRLRIVIEYAMTEARALGHNYVGTEHLLLGLIGEQEGIAAQSLKNLGVRWEEIMKLLKGSENP